MKQKRVAQNTLYITLALIVQKILSFVYFWFISNGLTPNDLGKYVFALSLTTLFSVFTDLGIVPVLIRESSKKQDKANDYLQNIFGIKIILSLSTFLALSFFITISNKGSDVKTLVFLASIIMIIDTFTISLWAVLRSRKNLIYESIATIVVQVIIFTLGLTALKTTGKTSLLIGALVAASIFNFCYAFFITKTRLHFTLKPKFDKKTIRYFLTLLPYFALGGIFVKIYNTADSVLLGFLASDTDVGFYAVPAKVITAFTQILPAAFATAIYPVFSSLYTTSKDKLSRTFESAFLYILIISLPLTFGMIAVMRELLFLVWPSYTDVLPTFFVMTLAIPFIFLSFPTGYLLNASDKQKNNTFDRGLMTLLVVILNLLLIPKLGTLGAGIAFLAANILLFTLDFFWTLQTVHLKIKNIFFTAVKSLFASIVMFVLVFYLKSALPLVLSILVGAISYFVVLFLTNGLRTEEFKKIIRQAIKKT